MRHLSLSHKKTKPPKQTKNDYDLVSSFHTPGPGMGGSGHTDLLLLGPRMGVAHLLRLLQQVPQSVHERRAHRPRPELQHLHPGGIRRLLGARLHGEESGRLR